VKEKNPNALIAMIAVVAVAILNQSSGVESPALAYIAKSFPETPMTTIVMITTLPSLMIIPASLLFSAFRKRFTLRSLFVVFMLILIVGGVMPAFSPTIGQILFWRALFGFGVGIMWPLGYTYIVELYSGNKQDTLLGFNSTVTAVGGIMWAMLGGILALTSWRHSFYAYFIPIIILIFCTIFLPEPKKTETETKSAQGDGAKARIGYFVLLLVFGFFLNACVFTYFTNLSFKIVDGGLGTSASAGLAQSCWVIGSLIVGVLYGFIMRNKFMKKYAYSIGWLLVGIGMLFVSKAPTYTVVLVASFIGGIGCGTAIPTIVGMIGNVSSKNVAMFLGLYTTMTGVAQFVGPQVFNGLVKTFNQSYGSFPMAVAAVIHIIGAIISFIIFVALYSKQKAAGVQNSAVSK
jgi:MFS family permease